ncbi:MAG: sugar ABC transporter substrate-binding protein [Arachnia sp.]
MRKALVAMIVALTMVFVGCSNGDKAPGGNDAGKTQVGMTFADLGNPVWAELAKEAIAYGAEKGIAITSVDAQNDSAKQVTQIENFIQSGVKAIIICAVESNALTEVTKKAQDAGIKVIGYTQVLTNVDSQLLVDAYNTGYANGEYAAKWIKEVYGDEPIEWGLMDLPTFPEIIDRANGIKDAIAKGAPNAKLVATAPALTAEDGVANAENFLQANPNMKVIATIGGGGASGANAGIKSAGVTDFTKFGLFGIDATKQEIQAIIDGDPQKSSISLGGGKVHGRTLVDMTSDLLAGKTIEKDQFMPIKVIDKSNAQEYFDEMFGS